MDKTNKKCVLNLIGSLDLFAETREVTLGL